MKRILPFILTISLAAGCSGYNDARGKGDTGVKQQPDVTRKVWPNGDGFPNVSAFCIGENGVYTYKRDVAPFVVASDPNCQEGGILYVD